MMRKIKYISFILLGIFIFAACSKDDTPGDNHLSGDEIAISYAQKKYITVSTNSTRDIEATKDQEENINNIYILMAKPDWSDIKRFYSGTSDGTSSGSFSKGQWSTSGQSVVIKLTQAQAGTRNVYVIANLSADMKSALDGVTNLAGLQVILETKSEPWSGTHATNNLKHPILMSGMENHDFSAETGNRVSTTVELVRAFAKVELNVKLPAKHQAAPTYSSNGVELPNYQYNFVDFDKNTYVLENTKKPDDQKASTGNSANTPATWVPFSATGTDHVSSYTVKEGKVTELKIVTYLNETTNANSYIEIQLPYKDGGFLPPPEFGPETFILPRQGKIERNHWYKYDVEL